MITKQSFEDGKRLQKYRLRRGYTQKMLAQKCHCTQAYISMIESGKRKLSNSITTRICEVLDVGSDVLKGKLLAYRHENLRDEH